MKYEYFCDESYYDMWAVRPIGETRWGHCYHVPTQEEAKGLAADLEELARLRASVKEMQLKLDCQILKECW